MLTNDHERNLISFLFFLILTFGIIGSLFAESESDSDSHKSGWFANSRKPPADDKDPRPTIRYSTTFNGAPPEARDDLKRISILIAKRRKLPFSRSEILFRAKKDAQQMTQALYALGFYDAIVSPHIKMTSSKSAEVIIHITAGKRYTFSLVDIKFAKPPMNIPNLEKHPHFIKRGDPVIAKNIIRSEKLLLRSLAESGYPWAKILPRSLLIDRKNKVMIAQLTIDQGNVTTFGNIDLTPISHVNTSYILNRINFKNDEPYNIKRVEEVRQKINEHGLFSSVSIDPCESTTQGAPPMTKITLKPTKPRAIGAGLHYSTFDRMGFKVFWAHRNVFGGGEKLGITSKKTATTQNVEFEFQKPDFLCPHQTWINTFFTGSEKTRAYTFKGNILTTKIEKELARDMTIGAGISHERETLIEDNLSKPYRYFGFPFFVQYGNTDSSLNPTQGGETFLQITPFIGKFGRREHMLIPVLRQTIHLPLDKKHHHVLAFWGQGKLIRGKVERQDIPAHRRLYAGGSGSVRGYQHQYISPLSQTQRPLGGRSSLELGSEMRFRINEDFGVVLFLEGATVSEKTTINLKAKKLWGYGVGARYFTALGPLRFDVALPMKRRSDSLGQKIDKPFQLYISIGQAF
jgi:translocation and assembly module TamA